MPGMMGITDSLAAGAPAGVPSERTRRRARGRRWCRV